MPTPHNAAEPGDIAPLVLMPGDPRRAARIADEFLADARLVSEVRGITAYTGTYEGQPMSVMASGMGIPSISIYATELFRFYGVRRIVRVGTCGAIPPSVGVGDIVIASCAHTDSTIANASVPGISLSFAPDARLLAAAIDAADATDATVHVGACLSSDVFYRDAPQTMAALEEWGTLAVEMEAAGLYACANRERAEALAVLTASDHLQGIGEAMTATQREECFAAMTQIAATALLS